MLQWILCRFDSSQNISNNTSKNLEGHLIIDITVPVPDFHIDFHLLAYHMTKLRNFTKGEIRDFSAFPLDA